MTDLTLIDATVREKLHQSNNSGIQTCTADYTMCPDDRVIQAKSRMRVECYIMTRAPLALGGECVTEPQKKITGFMVDGFFTIKDPNSDNMPGMC